MVKRCKTLCFVMTFLSAYGSKSFSQKVQRPNDNTQNSNVAFIETSSHTSYSPDSKANASNASLSSKGFSLTGDSVLSARLRLKSNTEIYNAIADFVGVSVASEKILPEETLELATGFFTWDKGIGLASV